MGLRTLILALFAGLVAAGPSAGAPRIVGPISGLVEASDGAVVDDLVVRLRCLGYGLHGAHGTDVETRIVSTGQRFRFAWAWGGASPVGCHVQVHHPLYVTTYTEVGDAFVNDLGTLRLTSWHAFLRAGPTDPPAHVAYPWPAMEIQQHLFYAHAYWLRAHSERARPKLARYMPALHELFESACQALPTSWHDDSPWNRGVRDHLLAIEQETGWQRPATQLELVEAARTGDAKRVQVLLEAGTDPDARDSDGAAPLHLAAQEGHLEAVRVLVDAGAEIDRPRQGAGDTPLLDAVQHHEDDVTLFLLEHGADPTYTAWRGTPLQATARQNASRKVVEALIAHGAIAKARDESHVVRALHTAARSNHTAILGPMLEAGVSADATLGPPNWTALMQAAKKGRVRAARMLIEAGAEVNAQSDDGQSPLSNAREGGHEEVAAMLEAAGASDTAGSPASAD